MPTRPTCKVVKREGQRGARIDPKGCKVRTTKDTQGNKRQYNKRGEEKITLKTKTPDDGVTSVPVTPLEDGLFDMPMIDDFARATLVERAGGNPPECSAQSGLAVQATIDAAFQSAKTKQLVDISY